MFRGSRGFIIICILAALLGSSGAFAYYKLKTASPEKILNNPLLQKKVNSLVGDNEGDFSTLLPQFLGFTKPRTYLFLFENNTEIRPGGGFIGVYSVVQVDKGRVNILKTEGTELLDKQSPADWKPNPPKILQEHLGVDRWYFRDSNWSPDFSVSANKALELFAGEKGEAASDIDTVIAFTPTVLQRLMKLTGPFIVEGIEFTADNVVEKLEYEVEYDYADNGRSFEQRKGIVKVFMEQLLEHVKNNAFLHLNDYMSVFRESANQKHILFYSKDAELQKVVARLGWTGNIKESSGDYLLWVDANLAALKTDHVMQKKLTYSFAPQEKNIIASAKMTYIHKGVFDWRTTRYRSYARVYVPIGSELLEVKGSMKWDRSKEPGVVDKGVEGEKQWFGTFIAIEPGQTGTLEFVYKLPSAVKSQIDQGKYDLFVQKQLGVENTALTISLNFGKNIQSALPAEEKKDWGDTFYTQSSDLLLDREFRVGF